MAITYQFIASSTVSSGTSPTNVTFSSVPSNFTDLILRFSARSAGATATIRIYWGTAAATYSNTILRGDGGTATSTRASSLNYVEFTNGAAATGSTALTFSSGELYIPNYTTSNNKVLSVFNTQENNAATSNIVSVAGLRRSSTAISDLLIDCTGGYVDGSSFYLYGIKNS